MFDRIQKLFSEEDFQKFQQLNVLLIGIGGVGGYALECLVRSGIINITIVDPDIIEESNLNRQIISNQTNIGMKKVEEAKKRAEMISPTIKITALNQKLTKDQLDILNLKQFDCILDACDDVNLKLALIKHAHEKNIKICSCLGTANRIYPEKLCITKLKNTKGDPLAKKIRNQLNVYDEKLLNTSVIWSEEIPQKTTGLGTFCAVPMSAGALLASFVMTIM